MRPLPVVDVAGSEGLLQAVLEWLLLERLSHEGQRTFPRS